MFLGGPGSFGLITASHEIEAIAELGVSLLLFSLGLEFSVARIKSFGKLPVIAGVLQVIGTLTVLTLVALLLGASLPLALTGGILGCLSSTAVVLRTLVDRAETDSLFGRNAITILLVQDLAVVPLAILMKLIVDGGDLISAISTLGIVLGYGVLLTSVLYLALNIIAVRVLGQFTLLQNRELALLLSILTGLGSAFGAYSVGLSPALGSFIAGMFLGSSLFATQIRADISSLRIILLTLFFGSAGMVADPSWIGSHLLIILFGIFVLILVKSIAVAIILAGLRYPPATAFSSGLVLAQVGEFAFVLGKIAYDGGVLTEDDYQLAISLTIGSLLVSPSLIAKSDKIGEFIATTIFRKNSSIIKKDLTTTIRDQVHEVIIVGYGPAGRSVGKTLQHKKNSTLIFDLNLNNIAEATQEGFHTEIADATHFGVWEHHNLQSTKVVIITLPSYSACTQIVQHVRHVAPHARIVVRARFQSFIDQLLALGVDEVVSDEVEAGSALGRRLEILLKNNPE
jgi:CPA2 family monovalent cation:H+ antiporter-2